MGRNDARATARAVSDPPAPPPLGLDVHQISAAFRDGALVAHYQPIVRLEDGAVTAHEALLRLRPPRGALLGPESFLATCERSGMIVAVGEWMLREACRQAVRWGGAGIAVNVSPHQLVPQRLIPAVEGALAESGLDPRLLCLELTESALLPELPMSMHTLALLRDIGVRIAIDDFGAGHASIRRLRDCPADLLKLDRSFVAGVGRDRRDTAIVQMTADLAAAFGLEAVAEGVETAEQAQAVTDMGYPLAQGFFYAEPLPATSTLR
jgi:EAL domain-containing protein (putative c-di-GMP-specific phosphodiesterase class I)